jgi:hypothetical protein
MIETVTLAVSESQLIEWIRQLSPRAKQNVLKALVPDLDELNRLVDYGSQRMRQLCAEHSIDWDNLSEEERQDLVDEWLHGT